MYNFFSCRYELERIFSNDFKTSSKKEKAVLRHYFKQLKIGDMQTIVIDE